jgi:hypothetical protein
MRAKEFIAEQERDVSGEHYHGLPFPSAQTITGADRTYKMYRHGVAMARAPEQNKTMVPSGPIANNYWLVPYSEEEQDIINKANNIMGFTSKFISNKGKKEEDGGHAISPLPQNSGKKIRKGS